MSAWFVIQILLDVVLLCGLGLQARKMLRPPKDDPRLSRGLQLLQSKIAVLEDLSDRTEIQVKQLSSLLDQKTRDVQERIYEAEHHVQLIKRAMEQSLEIAEIFQDKIPHQEIIERQNTKKYILAAQLAHEGRTVDEIAKIIDLPREELVLIAKINREHLVFEEDQLPPWAVNSATAAASQVISSSASLTQPQSNTPRILKPASIASPSFNQNLSSSANQNPNAFQTSPLTAGRFQGTAQRLNSNFTPPEKIEPMTLERLGDEFRRSQIQIENSPAPQNRDETSTLVNKFASTRIFQKAAQILESPGANESTEPASPCAPLTETIAPNQNDAAHLIRPFEFKKMNISDTLG